MPDTLHQSLLRHLPSISELLATPEAEAWLAEQPRELVTRCLREAVAELREQILADRGGQCGTQHIQPAYLLEMAWERLRVYTEPHIRRAINATGIILHTGLGRAVLPASVVDSLADELKGYVSLAIDKETGERLDRDRQVEYLLTELTGAEAATVVNNNAGATLLVLAALAAEHEVIVSRGQLIEIGGSFRLPEVMALSRAQLVEVGATNRTHARDYTAAITAQTAAILRVHPSNYRIVGFTSEPPAAELAAIAHAHDLLYLDDLGAGALLDLAQFGLPHEPTAAEAITHGADVILFSADKLIGAAQAGIIAGRADLIARIRKHPLARALRADKTCLMVLERTLPLFRDPARLTREHPTFRMLTTPPEVLQQRAEQLAAAIHAAAPRVRAETREAVGYLGSGSLPMEQLPTWVVALSVPGMKAAELARRLRLDAACVCTRIEHEQVLLDTRTLADAEVPLVAAAAGRVSA